MTPPAVSCTLVIHLDAVDDLGLLDLRESMGRAPLVPAGARVRLRLGQTARRVLQASPYLVELLRPASHVEIEAPDPEVAAELYGLLRRALAELAEVA